MKVKYFIMCAVFSVALTSIAAAADESCHMLNDLLASTKTLQAHFIQRVTDDTGQLLQQTRGVMALVRPGLFRWEVNQPLQQLIVANQDRLWIYDRDLEQVTVQAFGQLAKQAPVTLLLKTSLDVCKNFTIHQAAQMKNADENVFLLVPKDKHLFTVIQLHFKNQQIVSMTFSDQFSHTTAIEFFQIKRNITLPDGQFILRLPPGVDVIDETHSVH